MHIKNGDFMSYKNESIWLIPQKQISSKLDKNLDVDVLIIGGGITGINTAYQLLSSNLKVCLVEKNEVGYGVTSRTTAKLTYLQEKIYSKIKLYHNKDKAKLYLDSQKEAIKIARSIIEKERINCNLEQVSSYIFTNDDVESLNKEISLLKQFDIKGKKISRLPTNKIVNDGFCVDDTYVFHPLKYVYALKDICIKRGIDIYENTKILSIDKKDNSYICKTKNNNIKAKYVVSAMHYPYFLLPFLTPLKTYIEKSYIEASKVSKNCKFSAISVSKPTESIRYYSNNKKHYRIYLTNSHNLCIKNNEKKNFKKLMKNKDDNPIYLWSNKDIMTIDALPYIGSINEDNTFLIGTGYNTWGMTNGIIAGKVLADIILNNKNKYIELFNPKRGFNLGKFINFPLVLGSNAYSYIKSKLKKNKDWYNSNVRFENRDGVGVAIYTDEEKKEHIVYNLCPHMKCGLIFNEVEKTWDCPCHGSRFDVDGKCIEGPSNYNITYKE